MSASSGMAEPSREDTGEARIVAALVSTLFPTRSKPIVARVPNGVSTRVYRLRWPAEGRGDARTLYLRILPEDGASFVPEATAHMLARARGARVPEALYVDPCQPQLGRSVMVTSEIAGEPVWRRPFDDAAREILREAGRDLARPGAYQ